MDSDQNLIRLFHSMPFEIREKIQRFTYKTQHPGLLKEIVDFGLEKQYLQYFTMLVDTTNHANGIIETTDIIHERLWTGLNLIRHLYYKNLLLKTWKYKTQFKSADLDHENGEKNFRLLDWETSYAVNFWMCIYH